jgi:uncharacterized protein (TIGR02466 family)
VKTEFIFSTPVYYGFLEHKKIKKDVSCLIDKSRLKNLENPWYDNVKTSFKYDKNSNSICEFGLKSLKEEIIKHAGIYLSNVIPIGDVNITIAESWVNFYKKGNYQHFHDHSLADFCAVAFLKTNGEDGDLVFETPGFNSGFSKLMKNSKKVETASVISYKPEVNKIIFFPGYLKHAVYENKTENERISLAVNINFDYILK